MRTGLLGAIGLDKTTRLSQGAFREMNLALEDPTSAQRLRLIRIPGLSTVSTTPMSEL